MSLTIQQKLRFVLNAAAAKITKNRYKDLKVVGKWEESAHDEDGGRNWMKGSLDAVINKLREETEELIDAATETKFDPVTTMYEAGDVMAMAMMVMERSGVKIAERAVPKIVCLCGSTRFKMQYEQAEFAEAMDGNIVVSVGFYAHVDTRYHLTAQEKLDLDELHKRKIDLADEVCIISVDSYIGDSTRSEIAYAEAQGKPVRWRNQQTKAVQVP